MAETKNCQNCKNNFVIEPEDFEFYKRMSVQPPTFCPECRMIRRLAWRNERTLYKRKCQAPGHSEDVLSMYAPEAPIVIYDQKFWWSDDWDALSYGQDYDFSKSFFKQFSELLHRVPMLSLSNSNAVNSEYCNVADQSKDSYLCSGSFKIERTMYSNRIYQTTDCNDLYVCFRCELCYECISCTDSYRLLFSQDCSSCSNSYFLYDCRNCTNCIGCTNLRSKSYCIFNTQYSKEDYEIKVKELNLDSRDGLKKVSEEFKKVYDQSIHRYAKILKSVNTTGDNIDNAKNCYRGFDITEGIEDAKYVFWGGMQTQDAYDSGPGIGDSLNLCYEVMDSGVQSADIAFTNVVYGSQNIRYALYCHGSTNLFGCIGLRSKKYCILNKQYTKEEYEVLVPKIIKHMNDMPYVDGQGRLYVHGEYFPIELSPFPFNDSIAQDYFPTTENIAKERGYPWHALSEKNYVATMQGDALPEKISEVSDSILKEVFACAHRSKCNDGCASAYKIVPQELQYYKRLSLPLPQLCFNCRHTARLNKRNPMKLWQRQCMCDYKIYKNTAKHPDHMAERCPNKFETTYASERKEIIYCETCYQAEVS